jgi:predicted amidohydrolase YtcJ
LLTNKKNFQRLWVFVLAGLMMAPIVLHGEEAETVFRNGVVYTMDENQPQAQAVAVRDSEIIYVGSEAGLSDFLGPATRVVDLDGGMLLPGFIETHMHLADSMAYAKAAQLSPEMTPTQAIEAIKAHVERYPQQDPVIGWGFLGVAFGKDGPNAAMLDAIVADRAVFIFDEGFHTAWVNTEAMRRTGITKDTPDPLPGAHYYKRDSSGTPTGWLIEGGAYSPVAQGLGVVTAESIANGGEEFLPLMSSMGFTAAFDAGMTNGTARGMAALEKIRVAGDLPLRVVASLYVNTDEKLSGAVGELQALGEKYNHEFLNARVLKLSLDGTVEARTAFMLEPWVGEDTNTTRSLISGEQTNGAMLEAAAKGIDVHIHAIGDAAVHWGLDLVEQARKWHPESDSRYTICHIQVVTPEDVTRFGELDVIAQSTPSWSVFDEWALESMGQERFEQMYPLQSIAAGGAKLTFGSDYPASWIGVDGLNPMFNIEMAMTRQPAGDSEYKLQPPASERVTLEQALRAYTSDAAYQLRLEHKVGSIEVGKQADLVVMDRNLLEIDTYTIHQARVIMTMMNGRITYE